MTLGTLIKDVALWVWNNPLAALLFLLGYAVIKNARKTSQQKAQFGLQGILYEIYEILFTGISVGKILMWISLFGIVGRWMYITTVNSFNGVDTENLPRIGDKTPVAVFNVATPQANNNSNSTTPAEIPLGWYELKESATCRAEPSGASTMVAEIPAQEDFQVDQVNQGDGFCVGNLCRRVHGKTEAGVSCWVHESVLGQWIKK